MNTHVYNTAIERDSILTHYKGECLSEAGIAYAPYVPNMKRIVEECKDGLWTTFTFFHYDSHNVAEWANTVFGQTTYDLKGGNYIKIYLSDPDQITTLRLTWL